MLRTESSSDGISSFFSLPWIDVLTEIITRNASARKTSVRKTSVRKTSVNYVLFGEASDGSTFFAVRVELRDWGQICAEHQLRILSLPERIGQIEYINNNNWVNL